MGGLTVGVAVGFSKVAEGSGEGAAMVGAGGLAVGVTDGNPSPGNWQAMNIERSTSRDQATERANSYPFSRIYHT
jgi:hypothetical protein